MKVEYNHELHEYKLDGLQVRSVTQILDENGLSDFSFVAPDVLKRAGEFGDAVHSMTVFDDTKDLDEDDLDPDLLPYLEAWRKFKKESGFYVFGMEQIVYSEKYLFAGTYDRVGIFNDKLTMLDIKSGVCDKKAIKNTGVQTAGYAIAYDEGKKFKERIKRRIGVWLTDTGEPKLEPLKDKNDYTVFRAALTMANFKGGRI